MTQIENQDININKKDISIDIGKKNIVQVSKYCQQLMFATFLCFFQFLYIETFKKQ